MKPIASGEVVHHFSAIAARVAAGEELTDFERKAQVLKALSFRMTQPYGKSFERSDAYND
jgi:hypothetical protein